MEMTPERRVDRVGDKEGRNGKRVDDELLRVKFVRFKRGYENAIVSRKERALPDQSFWKGYFSEPPSRCFFKSRSN